MNSSDYPLVDQFLKKARFVYPLFFESGDDAFPCYCGGTCFAVSFSEQLFIVTAAHCLKGRLGDPCIAGPDRQLFPLRQPFTPVCEDDDNAWADITCVTTYEQQHWPSLSHDNVIDLDRHVRSRIQAEKHDFLVTMGYPASLTKIDPPKIYREPSLHIGAYGGPTSDRNCHFFNVIHPQITDPDGMSGSPVFRMDYTATDGPHPTLLGVTVQGSSESPFLRFIGVNILLKMLTKVVRAHSKL